MSYRGQRDSEDWRAAPLKTLCKVYPGKTPERASYASSGDIRMIKFRDIKDDGSIDFADGTDGWVDSRYCDASTLVDLPVGAVLLTNAAHSSDHIGKKAAFVRQLPDTGMRHCFVGELTSIRSKTCDLNTEWLYYFILSDQFRRMLTRAVEGAHLVPRALGKLPIAYPNRTIQEAHLYTIQNVEQCLTTVRAKLMAARRVKTALMQQLFARGVPGRHGSFQRTKWFGAPQSWTPRQLRQIAQVEAGFTMGRDLSGSETLEVAYLTVVNVQDGTFDLKNIARVEVKKSELEGLLLQPDDILMTEGGDRDKLGRGGMWRGEVQPCVYQNHIFRVRLAHATYKPELFHYLIQTWQAKNYFFAHAKQTSNLCTINSRELKRFPLYEPPPDEQEEMVDLLTAADAQVAAIESEIEALLRLKRALLQNLLTGRIRVGS